MSGVVHPLVITHPESKQKALYLHLGWTGAMLFRDKNNGSVRLLQEDELSDLMNFYHNLMETIKYTHVYQPGDLVVADNMAVAHRGSEEA
mmetsp:Transcript_47946/g.40573  ORF Transcript_47946/g.40573 Transcript_47946/m.40573 type:complete len:90 (+) Transcript_47946:615-884(+)